MSESYVNNESGIPRLYINGEPADTLAYITYLTENNRYADFARAGYRLFSVPVFFGKNRLNENTGLEVFTDGIFDGETPDFSIVDADIERILEACPNAYILPRVNISLSRAWELEHPDELCEMKPDGRAGRASLASDVWLRGVRRRLECFIKYVMSAPYAEHIIGFQIAGGNTEKWLPLDANGISGKRATDKFIEYLAEGHISYREGDEKEEYFYRFYSELVAHTVCLLARDVKKLTGRRLVVGTFYGYTLECPSCTSGHHELERVLNCEDIDFICSPISYSEARRSGRDHPYMLPVDSVMLHGKLYFSENDTRTHLSRPVNDTPYYTAPVWYGPDKKETIELIKLHAARALVRGHSAWWFDMWGGWFDDPEYMSLMTRLKELADENKCLPHCSSAEVAVFIDEWVLSAIYDPEISTRVCSQIREALGKMGTPYDIYLARDISDALDEYDYRAAILLEPFPSSHSTIVSEILELNDLPLLTITPQNADISSSELRDFVRSAGVHLYFERDAVVYASEDLLLLHTTGGGDYELIPYEGERFVDALSGKPFDGKSLPAGHTYILKAVK